MQGQGTTVTVEQWLLDTLEANGLFAEQAKEVMNGWKEGEVSGLKAALENADQSMSECWNDSIEGYVNPIKAVWMVWLKDIAVEYIDEKCPEHWARPLFAN